jgi:hypothetical protein
MQGGQFDDLNRAEDVVATTDLALVSPSWWAQKRLSTGRVARTHRQECSSLWSAVVEVRTRRLLRISSPVV